MAGLRTGFTTRASCLIAAGGTALICGLLLGEVDLVRAGVLAIAIPFISALVVLRSRVRIANRRSADPARAAAGEAVGIHLTITNRSVLATSASAATCSAWSLATVGNEARIRAATRARRAASCTCWRTSAAEKACTLIDPG